MKRKREYFRGYLLGGVIITCEAGKLHKEICRSPFTDGRISCFTGESCPKYRYHKTCSYRSLNVIKGRTITLEISEEEIKQRFSEYKKPEKKGKASGYLNLYSRLALSADKGAIIPHR